ncbi:MAG: SGNH/GDSL hydrolase family protein [Acidimicrobiales bacterium]
MISRTAPITVTEPLSLPPLRRPRRPVNLARVASLVSKGVAAVDATVEPFAAEWDRRNAAALTVDGPLWVALGDSVTQGIGAGDVDASYPAIVVRYLRETTGEPWRLINLSMSGARFADVVDPQLTVLRDAGLEPDLVTALVGSNDLIWRRDTDAVIADARRLVDALPGGTILSRVAEGPSDRRRLGVNRVFTTAEAAGRVRLYDAWAWPSAAGMWAQDRFHPNDRAHEHLAENLLGALS